MFYAAQVLSMRYNKPAIIFIDEIDAIGESRDSGSQSTASTGLLTQLLISMDGMGSDGSKIFVIAASNRPDALDPALMRYFYTKKNQSGLCQFQIVSTVFNILALKECSKFCSHTRPLKNHFYIDMSHSVKFWPISPQNLNFYLSNIYNIQYLEDA